MTWNTSKSTDLGHPKLASSSKFLQLNGNFFNYLITVVSYPPFLTTNFFFGCIRGIMAQFKLIRHKFLRLLWHSSVQHASNTQRVSALTTTILLNTVDTYHGLYCFGHVIYTLLTSMCQNIAELYSQYYYYYLLIYSNSCPYLGHVIYTLLTSMCQNIAELYSQYYYYYLLIYSNSCPYLGCYSHNVFHPSPRIYHSK